MSENNLYLNRIYMAASGRRPGAEDSGELADLRELIHSSRKKTADPKMPGARKMAAALRKVVGERFVQARELNGLNQTDASIRMGYRKSTQLSLWEKGHRLPPIDRMIIAALVYGVSLDFLYGLSDDPERDPRTVEQMAMVRSMEDMLRGHATRLVDSLSIYLKTGGVNMLTIKALNARSTEAGAAIRRFAELNASKFDDMRGSAALMHKCVELEALSRETAAMLARVDGAAEQAMRSAEIKSGISHPLFETPEYRQHMLGGLTS